MAHRGSHASYLAVASLAQRDLDPAVGDRFARADRRIPRPEGRRLDPARPGRTRGPVAQRQAVAQLLQGLVIRHALKLRPVGFPGGAARIAEARLQGAVVGQQEQALAVVVQAACGIDSRHRDEVGESLLSSARTELADHAEGLVEQ